MAVLERTLPKLFVCLYVLDFICLPSLETSYEPHLPGLNSPMKLLVPLLVLE